jgi:hypothetical protein
MVFDPTDPQVTAFRTQFSNAGQVNFWQSEFQTKLELANAAKECIGFEFFMDVTGDIVFKPPFYNLDILSNKPVSWIQDIDIIDWDLSESEAEVVTQVQISGSFGGNIDYGFGEEMTPATCVTDYHLLRRYGWRVRPFNSEFMGSTIHMFYMGMDLLDKYNSHRFRGTVNIPLRPELRLGFPIYLAPKDQIWYVTGISHNISFGGRAQTTLTLTAKRSKFVAPKGIGTLKLSKYNGEAVKPGELSAPTPSAHQLAKGAEFSGDVGDAAQVPPVNYPEKPGDPDPYEPLILRHPKTGRLVGYPNVVMAYTRPFVVPPEQFNKVSGQRDRVTQKRGAAGAPRGDYTNETLTQQANQAAKAIQESERDQLRKKMFNNRFSFGLTSAGVYTYLYDQSSVIKEMLLIPKGKIKFKDEETGKAENPFSGNDKSTAMIRPVSDERGFEVIGHYKYGRNVSLRDGSLVLNETAENPGALNSRAAINPQIAISGDLLETIQAQSQGLVSVYTGHPNPAQAIATLDPTGSDLQTAGIINPEGKPEFVTADTNFVDVAPLGSAEQAGTPNKAPASVEASQLSRALTLAELKVFTEGDPTVEECGCLMSRADLAFINVGYQVKVLRTTAEDNTTQTTGSMSTDPQMEAIQERQKAIAAQVKAAEDAARTLAENDPAITGIARSPNDPPAQEMIDQAVAQAKQRALASAATEYGISVDEAGADASEGEDADMIRPVASPTLTREEAISKVEDYLIRLYRALDGPHQEYEKVLRGEYLSIPQVDVTSLRFSPDYNPQELGGIGPPFSPSGRDRGGDPIALGQQGSSARQEIEKQWNEFGDELRANSKRAGLEEEIRQAEAEVADLKKRIAEQKSVLASGGTIVGGSTVDDLKQKLADAEQNLQNKKQELAALNNEYPPGG